MVGWSLDMGGYKPTRPPGRRPKVPRSMSHLKNEMIMSGLLKEIYSIDYCDVRTMSVTEKAARPGDITGNLSESGRVVVSLTMNDGRKIVYNWFVKILPKQHRNSELMNQFNIFENEIGFYKDIAPDLLRFLNENGMKDVEFDIPTLLFSDNTEEGAAIILEDVSEQGYSQERDPQGGRYLSVEKARLAIDAIAKIHAAAMLYNKHNTTKLEEKHVKLTQTSMWGDKDFLDRLSTMKEGYLDVLRKSSHHDSGGLLERFQKTFDSGPQLKSVCAERCAPKQAGAVYLQHGDFHYNNLLFKEEEGGEMKVMVVDWQLNYTGRSTGDVSYLLLSSIDPDVRHAHEQELKDAYFTSFNNYLKLYETSSINYMSQDSDSSESEESDVEIDVEDLDHDYQSSVPLSLFLSCGNVLSSDADRTATPDISDNEREQATVNFAYNLVKDAAEIGII